MEDKTTNNANSSAFYCKGRGMTGCGASSCAYGLGLIGAAIYFISQATTFWAGALGILKAIVWPAILVYELLKFLSL